MKELVLYQKHYDLILYSLPIINRFPSSQRFILGQQIQNCLVDIACLIVRANKSSQYRKARLYEIDTDLEKLRLLIRRAVDFLGYRIRADFKLLRKANLKRTKRKFRKYQAMYAVGQMQMPEIASSIKSWISHAGHADSWRIRTAVLDNLVFMRNKV